MVIRRAMVVTTRTASLSVWPPKRACSRAAPTASTSSAIELAAELGPERTVVTVARDTGLKYLAGDLDATCSPRAGPAERLRSAHGERVAQTSLYGPRSS